MDNTVLLDIKQVLSDQAEYKYKTCNLHTSWSLDSQCYCGLYTSDTLKFEYHKLELDCAVFHSNLDTQNSTTNDLEVLKRLYNSCKQLKYLDDIVAKNEKLFKDFLCYAGGAIEKVLINNEICIKDIDVFPILNLTKPDNIEIYKNVINEFYQILVSKKETFKIFRNKLNIVFAFCKCSVQFMFIGYNSVSNLLYSFDFGSCSVGLFRGKLYATSGAIFAIKYGYNIINLRNMRNTYLQRLVKKIRLGFGIIFTEVNKNIDPNILQLPYMTIELSYVKKRRNCKFSIRQELYELKTSQQNQSNFIQIQDELDRLENYSDYAKNILYDKTISTSDWSIGTYNIKFLSRNNYYAITTTQMINNNVFDSIYTYSKSMLLELFNNASINTLKLLTSKEIIKDIYDSCNEVHEFGIRFNSNKCIEKLTTQLTIAHFSLHVQSEFIQNSPEGLKKISDRFYNNRELSCWHYGELAQPCISQLANYSHST